MKRRKPVDAEDQNNTLQTAAPCRRGEHPARIGAVQAGANPAARTRRAAHVESMHARLASECLRKGIHLSSALSIVLAAWSKPLTLGAIGTLGVGYYVAERWRLRGKTLPLVSLLTRAAARDRDKHERSLVRGPLTLAIGVSSAILLFPPPIAAAAICALAFGDGCASLAGTVYTFLRFKNSADSPGRRRGRTTTLFSVQGKTPVGSAVCCIATALSVHALGASGARSWGLGVCASLIELLPCKDYDNITVPLGTGCIALLMSW